MGASYWHVNIIRFCGCYTIAQLYLSNKFPHKVCVCACSCLVCQYGLRGRQSILHTKCRPQTSQSEFPEHVYMFLNSAVFVWGGLCHVLMKELQSEVNYGPRRITIRERLRSGKITVRGTGSLITVRGEMQSGKNYVPASGHTNFCPAWRWWTLVVILNIFWWCMYVQIIVTTILLASRCVAFSEYVKHWCW